MEKITKEQEGKITEITITFQADKFSDFRDIVWDLGFKYPDYIVAHASGACGSHTIILINPDAE